MNLFNFIKPAKHINRVSIDQAIILYQKYRSYNFIGIFIGYASYYLMRGNFSLVMPYLAKNGFSKTQLGIVLSSLSIAYGISKFVMGNLSDRSNPRYFISIGLIISIFINLIFGLSHHITTSLTIMCLLMFINGWAQGMGAPPCYRTVAHWFSIEERGRIMSFWNISHNIGSGALGLLSMWILPNLSWYGVFYIPAIIAFFLLTIVIILMRDTPQSMGLMPIEEYVIYIKKENMVPEQNNENELTAKEILINYVFPNKYVWYLCFASIFIYFIRYGILNWVPTYLYEMKKTNSIQFGISMLVYELSGIMGIIFCGYISDKFFNKKRALVSILCLFIVFFGIILYWNSQYIIVSNISLLIIGIFIYGPIMLLGVQVLDIMPKKAVGTTIGLIGLFGYLGGNVGATIGFGYFVDLFGWNYGFIALLLSCVIASFFLYLTLNIKSNN